MMPKGIENIKRVLEKCSIKINDVDTLLKSGEVITINKNKDIENELEKTFFKVREIFPSHLHNPILYLLGELSDNINQHSNYSEGFIFLHYDKDNKKIHIMIFDDGITIPRAFEKNGIKFIEDITAINMAIKGKSTKKEEGRGYGLSSTLKLVEVGLNGEITIISRNGSYKSNRKDLKLSEKLNGTFVYINFNDKEESLNIYDYLK